jgi:hypothetical protein
MLFLRACEYEKSVDIVFPSVVSVFQDLGYIIKTADKYSGFIKHWANVFQPTPLIKFTLLYSPIWVKKQEEIRLHTSSFLR